MYKDDEADWQILKDYKKDKKAKLQEELKRYKRVENECQRKLSPTQREVAELESQVAQDKAATYSSASGEEFSGGPPLRPQIERDKSEAKLEEKKDFLQDLNDDIAKAFSGQASLESEIGNLTQEIKEIEEKIRSIRSAKHAQKKQSSSPEQDEPVEKCKRKCKIEDITVSCAHSERSFKLEVPPMEATGGEVPQFHVLSGANGSTWDKVKVEYGGGCGYGRSGSAPDAKNVNSRVRVEGADSYCPRVHIQNRQTETAIDRSSGVVFAPVVPAPFIQEPVRYLYRHFKNKEPLDKQVYDLEFLVCGGKLPYQAQVHAYSKFECDLAIKAGYVAKLEQKSVTAKISEEKEKSYDGLRSNGSWGVEVAWNYKLDQETIKGKHSWDPQKFSQAIGQQWSWLESLQNFFDPLSGFLEDAISTSGDLLSEKKLDKAKKKNERKGHEVEEEAGAGLITIEWPNIELKGASKRVELPNKSGVYNEASISLLMNPLFGIAGKIELMPLLLTTIGGPFGKFINYIANLEVGGEDKSYHAKTELSLALSASAKISGGLAYKSDNEKGWQADEGGSGLQGFLGFEVSGKIAGKGKVWIVKVEAGAEFKTTDEEGAGQSGIKASFVPAVLLGQAQCVGSLVFTGLAIVYALYSSLGVDNSEQAQSVDDSEDEWGSDEAVGQHEMAVETRYQKKAVLFRKRKLFETDKVLLNG